MAGFVVITGVGGSLGFRCAGVESVEAQDPQDVARILQERQASGNCGLAAVDGRLLEMVPEAVIRRLRKKGLPIIVPITIPTSWTEAGPEESAAVRLIRKAIGYQIKIKR